MDVYHQDLSKNLQRLRRDDKYTDVTIIPFGNRGKRFRCHRIILAAMSTYFETMFDAGLSETLTGEVELPCDDELCETILSFIYTGNNVSTKENVADLLAVANMMQIESLKQTCLNFLQSNLTQENCVSVMQTAHLQESKELFEQARSLVLKCFEFVAETEDFGLLDPQQLMSVLKADNLNCSDGRIICEAALSWIEADYENRIDYIGEILDALALIPVSTNTIEAKVKLNHPELQNFPLYNEKINSMKERGMCLAVMPTQDETMVVVGGSEGGTNTNVMAFSFRQKKWFRLSDIPLDPGYNFALCSNGIDMYASGGSNNKHAMLKYDGKSNSWEMYPNLPCPRQYHSMLAANNAVYIIGGCRSTNDPPIKEVDMFSLLTHSWSRKSIELPTPVRSASVAIQGDNLYIFGGIDVNKKPVKLAQGINVKEQYTYRVFYPLPEEVMLQSRAVTLGNVIYLIGKNGEVMKFSEKEKTKQVGKIHEDYTPRKGFGVCVFENKILIVGGEFRLQARKDMLQYNVEDNLTVLMQETLPLCRRDFCYAKLLVKQENLKEEY